MNEHRWDKKRKVVWIHNLALIELWRMLQIHLIYNSYSCNNPTRQGFPSVDHKARLRENPQDDEEKLGKFAVQALPPLVFDIGQRERDGGQGIQTRARAFENQGLHPTPTTASPPTTMLLNICFAGRSNFVFAGLSFVFSFFPPHLSWKNEADRVNALVEHDSRKCLK